MKFTVTTEAARFTFDGVDIINAIDRKIVCLAKLKDEALDRHQAVIEQHKKMFAEAHDKNKKENEKWERWRNLPFYVRWLVPEPEYHWLSHWLSHPPYPSCPDSYFSAIRELQKDRCLFDEDESYVLDRDTAIRYGLAEYFCGCEVS